MWQPWASLLAAGIKKIESRGQDTRYRGEFYIHAAGLIPKKEAYVDAYLADELFRYHVHELLGIGDLTPLPWENFRASFFTSAIVGCANLADTLPSWDLKERWIEEGKPVEDWEREFALGDHGSDRWAWVCTDHQVLQPASIKAPGQFKFWPIPADLVLSI